MSAVLRLVRAFAVDESGGNPAGVVLDADDLDESGMREIAAAAGLSETAFVSKSRHATVKLEFFTPTRRIAHCGHATIAAFALLAALGRVARDGDYAKETVDGLRRVRLRRGQVYMEQRPPEPDGGSEVDPAEALVALGLAPRPLPSRPAVRSTGNRFLLVELPDLAGLRLAAPRRDRIMELSERLDLVGIYAFARAGGALQARMFAPRYGIEEESGTGMAAGPLACRIDELEGGRRDSYLVRQGELMSPPSPCLIRVDLERLEGRIERVWAGGGAVIGGETAV